MSNILKEPYSISVWEEELIPAYSEYYTGENFTGDVLTEEEFKDSKYRENWVESKENPGNYYYIYGDGKTTIPEDELPTESNSDYGYEKVIMEHYEETTGIIIGAHDMDSPYAAANPIFKENVNGSVELTFQLYYKLFDPDLGDFANNPFVTFLTNEKKVKLNYRNKWYDLIVKNCVEDSSNYTFNYTCKDLYINELNKNGFKVELDSELENNQGTVTELAETILDETDWEVAPIEPEAPIGYTGPYSDIMVETKIEPLYLGTLSKDVTIKKISNYTPDESIEDETKGPDAPFTLPRGSSVLFFYSDIADNKTNPQILAHFYKENNNWVYSDIEEKMENYKTDVNEDIIINACNYEIISPEVLYVDSEFAYNIPSITMEALAIYENARGEKVIKAQRSGYDPDLDKFIFKYYKKGDTNKLIEYYGYSKTEILRSDLAQNVLANSQNFISLESGWYFDGVPSKTTKIHGKEKTSAYTGQIFTTTDSQVNHSEHNTNTDSVLVLELKAEGNEEYYPDVQGEYYLIKTPTYVSVQGEEATKFKETFSAMVYESEGFKNKEEANTKQQQIIDEAIKLLLWDRIYKKETTDGKDQFIKVKIEKEEDIQSTYYYLTSDYRYEPVNSETSIKYEDDVRALAFDNREAGLDGYADKTDEEIEDIINEILVSGRYSQRSRFAINTGVAANRKIIDKLNPGEEYLFAVSLGKFKEGEIEPNYGRELTYGAKVPSEYYTFTDTEDHNSFIFKATEKVSNEIGDKLQKDKDYYLQHPGYAERYAGEYNKVFNEKKEYYESRYLTNLGTVDSDARDYQRSGGKKYRELFLEYLRDRKTFNYKGKNITICKYIAEKIIDYQTNPNNYQGGLTKLLYDIFIDGKIWIDNPDNPIKSQYYYQGMYPSMIVATIVEAEKEQKKLFTINSLWEPMGYDKGQFPEFDDEVTKDMISLGSSFNERLCVAFYCGLKELCLVGENGAYVWSEQAKSWLTDETKAFDDIEHLFKTIYKIAYEEGKFSKAYDAAKDYKEGGAIYLAHQARWASDANEAGHAAAMSAYGNIVNLFAEPEAITEILNDPKEGVKNDSKYDKYYNVLKDINNYIEEQENVFKASFNINEIGSAEYNQKYADALRGWLTDKLGENTYGLYYYYNFFPRFKQYWISEQEIGTYVLAENEFQLNGGRLKAADDKELPENLQGGLETQIWQPKKFIPNQARHFEQGLFITYNDDNAKYVAVKTDYNPYLSTDTNEDETHNEAGGYVFDRNKQVIRQFNPEIDLLPATYQPVKDDDGDYIFDVFEQVYRPFREWSTKEKRHPVTFETDSLIGVYGDVIEHPIKAFDGHIGKWREEPTRYRMVRVRRDPINTLNDDGSLKYKYLDRETIYHELGYYKNEVYPYEVTYPAGYQLDNYEEADRGKYIKASTINKPNNEKLFVKLFGVDTWFSLFGTDPDGNPDNRTTEKLVDKDNKTFVQKVKDWLSNNKDAELDGIENSTDGGLLTSDTNEHNENRASVKVYQIDNGFISVPILDEIENAVETANAIDRGLVTKTEKKTPETNAEVYVKYKPWYWRHWGKDRYDYIPKICIQKTDNGVTTYKPFNKVEDVKSDDYAIYPVTENKNGYEDKEVSFYLKAPKQKFRMAKDLDYGTRKYRMDLKDKKNKKYWVEAPNGEAYLRHYKIGDGETKLWDGHFGRWIDCFEEFLVDAETDWTGWKEDDSRYPGLKVLYKTDPNEEDGYKKGEDGLPEVDIVSLPEFYLPYEDIMVPWDGRLFDRAKQRFTRQREKFDSERGNELYILSDSIYVTLNDYKEDNGFTKQLDYSGLRVSFVKDFKYNASDFSIKNLPNKEERDEYLQFNLDSAPLGYIDLPISKNPLSDQTIKERWAYWKTSVNKGFSLTEDPLQSLGMLFEYQAPEDDQNKLKTKTFPFLGMQMFRYVPYEKKEKKIEQVDALTNGGVTLYFDGVKKTWGGSSFLSMLSQTIDYLFGYGVSTDVNEGISPIYPGTTASLKDKLKFVLADETRALFLEKFFSIQGYAYTNTITKEEIDGLTVADLKQRLQVNKVIETPQIQPLFPGEVPDARDLIRLNYYIYNPQETTNIDNVIYEYVGSKPLDYFEPSLDELCQKIRSVKGKESNYFKLLQDCCNTFDCWIDPIIEHEENGQIKYIEKPVYIQTNALDKEPQIYVGENSKNNKVDKYIHKIKVRYGFGTQEAKISFNNETGKFEWCSDKEIEVEQQLDLDELNRIYDISQNLTIQYIKVPDKKIRFKRYVGETNYNGFKYGVNLKHIKRTIDSNQISTRIIVKQNKNEYATDGFCSIARAHENPIKENFILDFSYYTAKGDLKNSDLIGDLYSSFNTKLNYYNKLARLNKDNEEVIDRIASLKVSLDNVKAKYETAVLARDAAAEEAAKLAITITSNYDSYGQVVDIPWTEGKSQEYITRKQTSSPAMTFDTVIQVPNSEPMAVTIEVPQTATAIDYPKYNDSLRTLMDQMDIYQKTYAENDFLIEENLKPEKERIENEINELLKQQRIIVEKKIELNKLFYHKYSRFIQEGSWIDEKYMDDNLYYLDALSVARTSSKPKITYDIGVVDLSAAVEFEEDKLVLENKIGDRTYVEDVEFFGYIDDEKTPYKEEVVVSEKIYYLEDPSQNQTKVKNYTTQFDDLFQRIAATSQTLQFNEGSFNRAAALIQADGTLDNDLLQKTIASGDFIISTSINENVTWDNTGITVTNSTDKANVLKIVSRGVLISNDGGNNYLTAITGDGINADLLTAGRIDTKMLLIGSSTNPNFFWDELGISAFSVDQNKKIDYSSFVRLDQYGIYGIKGYENEDKTKLSFNNSFAPKSVSEISRNPNAVFGLTWDGFFLNASNGTGRVTIGTDQDFKMSEFSVAENKWKDRVIIGRLDNADGEEYYGFRLKNENNEIVMDTNDRGELYLKNKLRISNFSDTEIYYATQYVENGEPINVNGEEYTTYYYQYSNSNIVYYDINGNKLKEEPTNIDWRDSISKPQDRVTLGIVDTYLREYVKEEIEGEQKTKTEFTKQNVKGNYSSTDYLTKIMSVKVNGFVGNEPFSVNQINKLIENNETFAIFDNGNLYAKNAWIEGHINATSGSFTGHLEASTGSIGEIIIKNGGLQSKNYNSLTKTGWRLDGESATIELTDAIFHGTIQATDGYILDAIYVGSTGTDGAQNYVTIGTSLTVDIGTGNNKKPLKRIFSATNTNGLIMDTQTIETYLKQNPNETFAIFDNGQFHARNAYIKGHIEAESGKFTGEIEATTGKIGDILIANGGIQSKNYGETDKDDNPLGWKINPDGDVEFNDGTFNGTINAAGGTIGGIDISPNHIGTTLDKGKGWQISSDGTAEFRNVTVSGKITSTIFEYDKVQTVAGSMLIRPAIYFTKYSTDGNGGYTLTLDSKSVPEEFQTDNFIKFGKEFKYQNCPIYKIVDHAVDEEGFATVTLEPYSEDVIESDYLDKNEKIILHMGKEGEEVIGLGLNASNNGAILPSESFSLISLNKDNQASESYIAKVILGKLPNNVLTAFKGSDYASEKPEYGLYADNVYLKGEIIATSGKIGNIIIQDGGIQSQNYGQTDKDGNLLGWKISPDGSVVFNNGTFNGTINATEGTIGNIIVTGNGIQSKNYSYTEITNENDEIIDIVREGWRIDPNGQAFFQNAILEDCSVSGIINATEGKIGGLIINNNNLSSGDNLTGWKIDSQGDANFSNLFLNGQAIVYPSTIIQSVSQNEKTITLTFTTNSDLETWRANLKTETVKLKIGQNTIAEETFDVNRDDITFQSGIGQIVLRDIEAFNFNTNEILYFVPVSETQDSNYGIIINSSFSNNYPSKSISITEIYPTSDTRKTKLMLGYLDQNFLENANISKEIQGTYGLYCDNVWLQGNLIATSDTGIQAGVSTSGLVKFSIPGDASGKLYDAVFFSGYQGENPKFAVTKDGYLYAQNGYFQGKIAASEIVGIGEEGYGLTFKDLKNAIRFITGTDTKIFELSSNKTSFYDTKATEILNISSIGSSLNLFGNNDSFLLSITTNTDGEVSFNYGGVDPQIVFTKDGVKINGGTGTGIGENAHFEEAYNTKNTYIGCNIVLQ